VLKRRNSKRTLHFAATTKEHTATTCLSETDKARLWWSPQELGELQQTSSLNLSDEDLVSAADVLQQLWNQSTKTAAHRGSRGPDNVLHEPTVTSFDDDDWETTRGLEASLICHTMHSNRVAMRQGILRAQQECHQAHPVMKARILARTAAHLSRTAQQFALALAKADAKVVSLQ
jgi:hypothetical protein